MTPFNTPDFTKPRRVPIARFIGVPWISGGRDAVVGLDCWGLVIAAARDCFGLELPDYHGYERADSLKETAHLFEQRDTWEPIIAENAQAGDVVVLRTGGPQPAHAGLVVQRGIMLHSLAGRDACLERYDQRLWRDRVEGFYRWSPH